MSSEEGKFFRREPKGKTALHLHKKRRNMDLERPSKKKEKKKVAKSGGGRDGLIRNMIFEKTKGTQ